jgi:dihydroorotase
MVKNDFAEPISYISPIDPHVHLRGLEYAHISPSYASLAFLAARAVGLQAIIEQPNPDPLLVNEVTVNARVIEMDKIRGDIEHAIAVAITGDEKQIAEAVELISTHPRVAAGKTFFVPSTKSKQIEIVDPAAQRHSWKVLAKHPYGHIVRDGHYEVEEMFTLPFDPTNPVTHALRQGPESEVVQFERQFGFAYDEGFRGTLLVKHVSNPETIDLGEKLVARHRPRFKVKYETTFHHMFLNTDQDYPLHGNLVKMNPPLRSQKMQEQLLERVIAGRTHTIGTDHAPHPKHEKEGAPYKSGIHAIQFYPAGIRLLRQAGLKKDQEDKLLFHNSNSIYFGDALSPSTVNVTYDPSLNNAYGFNPFSRIDGTAT